MICENCKELGKKSVGVFTQTERMQMIAAQVSMLRSIEHGRRDSNDLKVANSIITKLLLSFDDESREIIRTTFAKGTGIDIDVKNCPHSLISL